jgi:hypothetical protein
MLTRGAGQLKEVSDAVTKLAEQVTTLQAGAAANAAALKELTAGVSLDGPIVDQVMPHVTACNAAADAMEAAGTAPMGVIDPFMIGIDPPFMIGINPGLTGGLAVLSSAGQIVLLADVPVIPNNHELTRIDGSALHRVLAKAVARWPARAIVERVSADYLDQSRRGVTGALMLGMDFGAILGVLQALHIETELITARAWKRAIGFEKCRSGRLSLSLARRLYPCADLSRDDARAEARAGALLLAHYALHRSVA